VKPRRNPRRPRTLDSFKLFAILGTWMEGDVVRATVQNAFAQGCDRVFLFDNDSADDTVEEAVAGGAELVESFPTEREELDRMTVLMNEKVARISEAAGDEHIWWLWIDADEFPHGPRGLTVREFLATLDASFRLVGSRFFDHYPSEQPHYVRGFHPLDFQPLATERIGGVCWSWHYKHPLQRFDRNGATLTADCGFHVIESQERPLLEPTESILTHHFPWRGEETTSRRLHLLCSGDDGGSRSDPTNRSRAALFNRFRSISAVYGGDWKAVGALGSRYVRPRWQPVPWKTLVRPEDANPPRWYGKAWSGNAEAIPS